MFDYNKFNNKLVKSQLEYIYGNNSISNGNYKWSIKILGKIHNFQFEIKLIDNNSTNIISIYIIFFDNRNIGYKIFINQHEYYNLNLQRYINWNIRKSNYTYLPNIKRQLTIIIEYNSSTLEFTCKINNGETIRRHISTFSNKIIPRITIINGYNLTYLFIKSKAVPSTLKSLCRKNIKQYIFNYHTESFSDILLNNFILTKLCNYLPTELLNYLCE